MYQFWLGEILLPVAPEKVTISTAGKNETYTLVDGSEINIVQSPKLKTIKFEALIPYREYPFAHYGKEFTDGDQLREKIENIKNSGRVFQFVITRKRGTKVFHYTDIRSTIEDIIVTESVDNGFDIKMALTLKEYKEFGAKFVSETGKKSSVRQQDNAPNIKSYTVNSGDSLWKIAKKFYGDGSKWRVIYEANKSVISNPNVIKNGIKINIP